MTKLTLLRYLSITLLFVSLGSVNAEEMRHNFTLTGTNGETGTGFFTWENTVILDGNAVDFGDALSGSVTINGGTTPGGTQTFDIADWTSNHFENTPTFLADINIWANNGAETLLPPGPAYIATASWGSDITFIPGATVPVNPAVVQPIPLLDAPGLIIISLLVGLTGLWQVRRLQLGRAE